MVWRCRNHLVAVLGLALGACASVPTSEPTSVLASEPAHARADPPAEAIAPDAAAVAASPVEAAQQVLEATRRSARSTAEWLARGVDSWFGSRPFEDGGKVSNGRLSLGFLKRQDQSTDVDVRFTAQFRLPNVERRAYLFVGRDVRRDVVRDTPDDLLRQQRLLATETGQRANFAGVGLALRDAFDFRIGIGPRARPYAQARFDESWTPAPDHVIDFRETLFWTHDDRAGSTTALSYDWALSPTLALRWLNAATITQQTRNFELSSSLGAYRSLGDARLLSLEAVFSATGTHGAGVGLSDVGLLARWSQPIYKTWMFGEIVGGHFWPRPQAGSQRGRAWAAGGSLRMHF